MKTFRFKLESVLTLRNWEEERARTACGQALRQEQRIALELRAVEQRVAESIESWHAESARPGPAREMVQRRSHLHLLERERTDTAQKLLSARRIREQKMKLLVDAHRRVKVLESLRSRQQHVHLAEALRREERELEDLTSARFQAST